MIRGQESGTTPYQTGLSYETVFGIDSLGSLDGKTLLEAFSANGAEGNLAKQATAALLNSASSGELPELTQNYRFSTDDVIKAVQEVYDDGGFNSVQAADLQDLLEFWNTAPENNTGAGATVPGELHSEDTTTIATTLEYNGTHGGSFEGDIIQVLHNLHPNDGWLL